MLIKIKIHSMVDIITNSSTVIYTYCDSCVSPTKELINEFAKIMGFNKTADEMFWFGVFLDDEYVYAEWLEENHKDWQDTNMGIDKFVSETIEGVLKGEMSKPVWMQDAEQDEGWSGFHPSTQIVIKPKSDEYDVLGQKIHRLMSSIDQEACQDG